VWRELEQLGIDLLMRAVPDVAAGRATFRPQTGPAGRLYRDPALPDLLGFWWKRARTPAAAGSSQMSVRVLATTGDAGTARHVPAARPIRVLLVTETYHPEIGGGERQANVLARALVGRRHPVTILTRRSRRELAVEEFVDGIRILRIGPSGTGRWKKWGLVITAIAPLLRLRNRYDVVFVSGYRILGIPVVTVGRLLRRASVLKADSSGEMSGEFFRAGLSTFGVSPGAAPMRVAMALRNSVLRRAASFVAISDEIVQELEAVGIDPDRIARVPNGVDTDRFRPANSEERDRLRTLLRLPPGRIVVFTGRLVSYKGLPTLLEAWHSLVDAGTEGTLVLVGTGSSDIHNCERELRELVEVRGLTNRVIFTGPVENVDAYLRAADVFAFPTENEAFGLSLVEAMACGLPCVSTPVGGIPDFVVDGHNGLLIPPKDPTALRDALARLVGDDPKARSLGAAARKTVLDRFSHDAVADAYVELFSKLVPQRARAHP
jgi:glycosyltransferase involved in cell wall biosynthesis